jgi:hypothetical protein
MNTRKFEMMKWSKMEHTENPNHTPLDNGDLVICIAGRKRKGSEKSWDNASIRSGVVGIEDWDWGTGQD